MHDIAVWVEAHKNDITYFVLVCLIVSQASEAYGQWLADEDDRKAKTLKPQQYYTAFGRLLKPASLITLLVSLLIANYG